MATELRPFDAQKKENRFVVTLATAPDNIEACLRLRYQVFAEEHGAQLDSAATGLDKDRFDDYCKHLMVYDNQTEQVVATTRLLSDAETKFTNGFYSETEFNLQNILDACYRMQRQNLLTVFTLRPNLTCRIFSIYPDTLWKWVAPVFIRTFAAVQYWRSCGKGLHE